MKETPVISNTYATNISSKHVSFLCFVVCILSLSSSLFELWILIQSWWSGEAFTDIYMGYLQSYPELGSYDVNFRSTRIYTVILDYMSFIPYYTALILSSIIFYRFRSGIFWDKKT
ncbi:hypothetical protein VPR01S_05_01410 [Vibrio proteolyticus NBRC 13287]|uniref:Uncharacterized protein n=1 Tax=Vibrio proteolyticus NBRC 13287 TaxID=1219065 RepID=U2ZGR0_VIBPR|nr:hypothetical protein VPR01S_05_01410 [Vibrio proteolyticus NBRC 13287]